MVTIFVTVAVLRLGFGVFAVSQSPLRQFLLSLWVGR
jgi:hypothetical protein